MGEVDLNPLTPFSVTINYTPQATSSRANVTISVSYEDSLGNTGEYAASIPTTLRSASQLAGNQVVSSSSASDSGQLPYLEYGVIALLAVVAIVGAIYVRRQRAASAPVKDNSDSGVI